MPKQTGLSVDEITKILNSTHLYSENFPPLISSKPPKSFQPPLPSHSSPWAQKSMEEEEPFVPDYSPISPSPNSPNNSHIESATIESSNERPKISPPSPTIEKVALSTLPSSKNSSQNKPSASSSSIRPLPLLSLPNNPHTKLPISSTSRRISKQNYPISILSRVRILDNGNIQKLPLEDHFIASKQLARLKKLTNREIKATSRLQSRISFVNSTNVATSTHAPQMANFSTVRKIHLNPNVLFQSSSQNSLPLQSAAVAQPSFNSIPFSNNTISYAISQNFPTTQPSMASPNMPLSSPPSIVQPNVFSVPPPSLPSSSSQIQHVPILVPISLFSAPGVSCPNFAFFPNHK